MSELEALKEIYNGMYNKIGFIKEFKLIEKALQHAKKQEELLGLYRELAHHYTAKVWHDEWDKINVLETELQGE